MGALVVSGWLPAAWSLPDHLLAWAGASGESGAITPRDLVGVAGVPVVVGMVELTKRVFPDLTPRLYPVLALAFGVALNLALLGYSGAEPIEAIVVGLVTALLASGLYSQVKALGR